MALSLVFPPAGPTAVQNTVPSYLYVQYNDDVNLQSFVNAYNAYTQAYLDYMNGLNLPIYTGGNIAGALLDWVATGLYGLTRPALPTLGTGAKGPYNTFTANSLPFNGQIPAVNQTYYATTDDTYKRVLTWKFYKGDGAVFNVRWLKRRIARFLNGINGADPGISQTYAISVQFTGSRTATITVANSQQSTILAAAIAAGVLDLPFQTSWTVHLT